jgi:hypothetical protein
MQIRRTPASDSSTPQRKKWPVIVTFVALAISIALVVIWTTRHRSLLATETVISGYAHAGASESDLPVEAAQSTTMPDDPEANFGRPLFEEPVRIEEICLVEDNAGNSAISPPGYSADVSVPTTHADALEMAGPDCTAPKRGFEALLGEKELKLGTLFRLAAEELGPVIVSTLSGFGNLANGAELSVNDVFALDVRQLMADFARGVGEIDVADGQLFMEIIRELKPSWYGVIEPSDALFMLREAPQHDHLAIPWTLKAMHSLASYSADAQTPKTKALVAMYMRLVLELADIHESAPDREFVMLSFLGRLRTFIPADNSGQQQRTPVGGTDGSVAA